MPKNLWLIVIGMVVNVTGASFLWPLNTIYLHNELGKSLSVAGFVLLLNSFASVFGNLIGGTLYDKVGGYKSILTGILITLIALIGLCIFHDWPYYVIFLTIIGFGSGIVFPAIYALAGAVWPEGGRRTFNAVYVAQNLGVAIGSALGGLIASYSFNYIFIANTLMYVIFFGLVLFGFKNMGSDYAQSVNIMTEGKPVKNKSILTAILILCTGYLLCWVGYVQWQTTIASYTQDIGISLKQYSLLWTINGALIVLGQPIVNRLVNKFAKNLKKQILIGLVIFIGSFAVASFAGNFTGFLTAMVILTIGEMFVWPAVPTIASELSPKGKEGFYQGLVNSTATAGRMIGPLLGGFLVDWYGMQLMFATFMILFVVAMGTTIVYDRVLKREKTVYVKGQAS
ncbi:MDR family MFS transporter [Peribacillus alkalitolerans]|uniref:MDR family MFS transporter n=1 Tax=Peribacillus alkalitolerans TaxID=1550385 RepID=UPI0013D00991|nr:MFS transporter [Peribacillus alkalitolerans]